MYGRLDDGAGDDGTGPEAYRRAMEAGRRGLGVVGVTDLEFGGGVRRLARALAGRRRTAAHPAATYADGLDAVIGAGPADRRLPSPRRPGCSRWDR